MERRRKGRQIKATRSCGEVREAERLKNMEVAEHDVIYALCRGNSRFEYN